MKTFSAAGGKADVWRCLDHPAIVNDFLPFRIADFSCCFFQVSHVDIQRSLEIVLSDGKLTMDENIFKEIFSFSISFWLIGKKFARKKREISIKALITFVMELSSDSSNLQMMILSHHSINFLSKSINDLLSTMPWLIPHISHLAYSIMFLAQCQQ